jgi:hypothetical protein
LKYQKTIRDLKDENSHLRDETISLRKSIKQQQIETSQVGSTATVARDHRRR